MLSDRFKTMYRQLGLDRPEAAKLLHVSERTLHNWETGVHDIPYNAYKLLRLLSYSELPGPAWHGWHIAVGRLWSPEGHSFGPEDSSWWSALCGRARLFHVLYRENGRLRHDLDLARSQSTEGAEGLTFPVTRKVSLKSETNQSDWRKDWANPCPAKVRYNLPQLLVTKTVKGGGHV